MASHLESLDQRLAKAKKTIESNRKAITELVARSKAAKKRNPRHDVRADEAEIAKKRRGLTTAEAEVRSIAMQKEQEEERLAASASGAQRAAGAKQRLTAGEFKLVNIFTGGNLYAQEGKSGADGIGVFSREDLVDHWWSLEPAPDGERYGGAFVLRNRRSQRCLGVTEKKLVAIPSDERPAADQIAWWVQPVEGVVTHGRDGAPTLVDAYDGLYTLKHAASGVWLATDRTVVKSLVAGLSLAAPVYQTRVEVVDGAAGLRNGAWALVPKAPTAGQVEPPRETQGGADKPLAFWEIFFDESGDLETRVLEPAGNPGAAKFVEADVTDLDALVQRLRSPRRNLDRWIASHLAKGTKERLAAPATAGAARAALTKALVKDLNRIISQPIDGHIPDHSIAKREAEKLGSKNPAAEAFAIHNRKVLQKGYPEALGRTFVREDSAVALDAVRRHLRSTASGRRHVFVMVHGVSEDSGGGYMEYKDRMAELFAQYPLEKAGLRKEDITVLRINWKSQSFGAMLVSHVLPGVVMRARQLGELGRLAQVINALGLAEPTAAPTFHLVGHSMGTQVMLYLLPQIAESVKLGSVFLLQGFAPTTAFIKDDAALGAKATEFIHHVKKVKGPVVATTSGRDSQIAAAAAAGLFLMSPVLGLNGFQPVGERVDLHDLPDDEVEGGKKRYKFEAGKLHTLDCESYIGHHDDFKSLAVAWAHFHAAGLVPRGFKAERPIRPVPTAPTAAPDQWMKSQWSVLARRNLTQITLPGAHDAGAGIIGEVIPDQKSIASLIDAWVARTSYVTDYMVKEMKMALIHLGPQIVQHLSRTQVGSVGQQLANGCRYFDLRPANTGKGYHLAHVDYMAGIGWVGGIGQNLDAALKEIRDFAMKPEHSYELIVLNFSHFLNVTGKDAQGLPLPSTDRAGNPISGWNRDLLNEEEKDVIVKGICDTLGDRIIRRKASQTKPLHLLPLEELMAGQGNILCLFNSDFEDDVKPGETLRAGKVGRGFWKQRNPATGAFVFGPWDTQADFRLFDEYSDKPNPARVVEIQKAKYLEKMAGRRSRKEDGVFLLSWTTTLDAMNAILAVAAAHHADITEAKDINRFAGRFTDLLIERAKELNRDLDRVLSSWIARGDIEGAARPNIVYLDAYDRTLLPAVIRLNEIALR